MKLVIQIPCFNEAETIAATVADLPREVAGFAAVEYLVIDDGSTDGTADVARACGVHNIVRFPGNRGLAKAFMAGIDASLRLGADVIVNTDADNQYRAADIPALVAPILSAQADCVIGNRQVGTVAAFSPTKKHLQRFGSWVVRRAANVENVPDATSGFRAFSRDAALSLYVTSDFTYTLETIIQAGAARLRLCAVPVATNPPTRKSRLFGSTFGYVRRSASTIIRIYTMYNPLRTFLSVSALCFLVGFAAAGRFLYFYFLTPGPTGHIQSLILAAIMILAGIQIAMSALLADLVGANRKILEGLLRRLRTLEADGVKTPGTPPPSH